MKRRFPTGLVAFGCLLFLALLAARGETIVVDIWGNVISRFAWPEYRVIYVVAPIGSSVPSRSSYMTPTPRPCPPPILP